MLAPQRGQTRLRIAEIKVEVAFATTESEAIKSLPIAAILHRRMHRTVSGAASAFGEEYSLDRAAAPCFGFKGKSNRVAKTSRTERAAIHVKKIEWKFECRGDEC